MVRQGGRRGVKAMVGRAKRLFRSETAIALAGAVVVMVAIIRAAGG
jgi:hypothetical protein